MKPSFLVHNNFRFSFADAYFRLPLRRKDEIWARDLVHDSAKQKPMHRTSLLAFPFFLIRLFLVMISLQRKNI